MLIKDGRSKPVLRVNLDTADPNFPMQMWPGGMTRCCSIPSNHLHWNIDIVRLLYFLDGYAKTDGNRPKQIAILHDIVCLILSTILGCDWRKKSVEEQPRAN